MYYCSSHTIKGFGITDTEDNVEEFYTEKQLLHIIAELCIEIHGVSLNLRGNGILAYPTSPFEIAITKRDAGYVCKIFYCGDWKVVKYLGWSSRGLLFFDGNEEFLISRDEITSLGTDLNVDFDVTIGQKTNMGYSYGFYREEKRNGKSK